MAEWSAKRSSNMMFGESQTNVIDLETVLQAISTDPNRFTKQQVYLFLGFVNFIILFY